MREILWAKTKQVDLFRSELLRTQNRNLTHNLPDRFWGSCYLSNGKEYIGHNVFAILLMENVALCLPIEVISPLLYLNPNPNKDINLHPQHPRLHHPYFPLIHFLPLAQVWRTTFLHFQIPRTQPMALPPTQKGVPLNSTNHAVQQGHIFPVIQVMTNLSGSSTV